MYICSRTQAQSKDFVRICTCTCTHMQKIMYIQHFPKRKEFWVCTLQTAVSSQQWWIGKHCSSQLAPTCLRILLCYSNACLSVHHVHNVHVRAQTCQILVGGVEPLNYATN